MKKFITAAVLAASAVAAPVMAADVGVSIGISEPGVYGRIDIGRFPQPQVVVQQPVIIGRPVTREPVYLWVPPAHRSDWRHHCGEYRACGVPVYFVRDDWYGRQVRPYARGYDRDRDGIPDRYDRHDNRRDDRDRDGIPDRYDRHDNRRDDRGRGHRD